MPIVSRYEYNRDDDACTSCAKSNGPFANCRNLHGWRDNVCSNCMAGGEGYKRCSFVPGSCRSAIILYEPELIGTEDVKDRHKRKIDTPLLSTYRSVIAYFLPY